MAPFDLARVPIWRETRVPLEHAALLRDPVLRGEGVPRGDGAPVLLVPGFLAGDGSLALMARWLRRIGHRPCRAGMRANVDCATRAVDRLAAQVERFAERHGRPVTIVGQSRGGTLARLLAVRHPEHVRAVVALGSPLVDQFAVHPLVRAHAMALGALGTLGVPGLFSRGCTHGSCCEEARAQATAALPRGIRFVSVYSRSDGIVDWRACLDPAAEHLEVRSTHIGMAVNAAVFRCVAEVLAPGARAAAA
jgi:pimeloyl-ACP methyl ester carboxylesterase